MHIRYAGTAQLSIFDTSRTAMAIEVLPIPLPPTVDKSKFSKDFGREIKGVKPGELDDGQFKEISDLLYMVFV